MSVQHPFEGNICPSPHIPSIPPHVSWLRFEDVVQAQLICIFYPTGAVIGLWENLYLSQQKYLGILSALQKGILFCGYIV